MKDNRFDDKSVERMLHEGRPQARPAFVASVARTLKGSVLRVPRARLALAAALTLLLAAAVVAAANVGGGSQVSLGKLSNLVTAADKNPVIQSSPAQDQYGAQGCTPGYWKNHTSAWVGYSTGQTVGSVFTGAGANASVTLLAALDGGGGSSLDDKKAILIRAGVAALLNAASPGVAYAYSTAQVVAMVNAALATNDPDQILALAGTLDGANNAGCPLN